MSETATMSLLAVAVILFAGYLILTRRRMKVGAEEFIRITPRLDDDGFAGSILFCPDAATRKLVLDVREVLARTCRIPAECVRPDHSLGELYSLTRLDAAAVRKDLAGLAYLMREREWFAGIDSRLGQLNVPTPEMTVCDLIGDLVRIRAMVESDSVREKE